MQKVPARTAFLLALLYLSLVFIRPQEFIPALDGVPLLPLMMAIALFSWLLSENKQIDKQQLFALTLLFGYTILSVALSGWVGGMVPAAAKLIPIYVLFLLIASTTTTPERQRQVMWIFVGGAAMMAAHGIQQKFTGVGWTGEEPLQGRIRYIGIFNDPNDVGLLLVCSLPMAFYLLHYYRSWLVKLLVASLIACILYGIVLTNSRGTTLATAVLAGLYLWRHHGVLKTAVFGTAVIPVILMMSSRMDTLSASEESAHGRIEAWYEGFQMLKSNPLFGVGFDRFTEHHFLTAHNSFMLALAELGIVGYTLWFSFLLSCVAMMHRLRTTPSPERKDELDDLVALYGGEETEEGSEDSDLDDFLQPAKKPTPEIGAEDSAIANVIFFSFVGFATSAFFLSRTYVVVLFVLCALAVGHYMGTRQRVPELPPYGFFSHFGLWATISMVSIVFLYIITKVLMMVA